MRYGEVLKQSTAWMEESGVRDYCKNVCKGDCCNGHMKDISSESLCSNRLACTEFMCGSLRELFRKLKIDVLNKNIREIRYDLVCNKLTQLDKKYKLTLGTDHPRLSSHPYYSFYDYSKSIWNMEVGEVALKFEHLHVVSKVMKYLTDTTIKIRRKSIPRIVLKIRKLL